MTDPHSDDGLLVCVVEIPKGTRNKYEYDPDLGGIKFDRLLLTSSPYINAGDSNRVETLACPSGGTPKRTTPPVVRGVGAIGGSRFNAVASSPRRLPALQTPIRRPY
ncbi:MAG TPA: inorganic diphosphatase, partial [Solirubrobacteraceae bacterium]